jgi:hypothetical protein
MVEWKGIGWQLILAVLGSSLVASVISNLSSSINQSINQPEINISPISYGPSIPLGQSSPYSLSLTENQETNYTTIVMNEGRAPATDVKITFYYQAMNITNFRIAYGNATSIQPQEEGSDMKIVSLDRLGTGEKIVMDYTLSYEPSDASSFSFIADDSSPHRVPSIAVSYHEGYKEYEVSNPYPFSAQLLIIALAAAIILLVILVIPKKLKQIKDRNNHRQFVASLEKEISEVESTLSHDPKIILSSKLWDSKADDIRRQIFNNHEDYRKIDELYSAIKQRDANFQSNNINNNALQESNKGCVDLARIARGITWIRYYVSATKHLVNQPILIVPILVLGSLFITYVCEGLPFFFLTYGYDYENLGALSFAFLISLVIRSISAYFIIRTTIRTFRSFYIHEAEPGASNQPSSFYLNRFKRIEIIALTIGIMGVPSYAIIHFFISYNVFFNNYETVSFIYANFPVFILLSDIVRIFLLAFSVRRLLFRSRTSIQALYRSAAIITVLSGLLYLTFGMIVSTLFANTDPFYTGNNLEARYLADSAYYIVGLFFVPIGIAQILWALPMVKQKGGIWCYVGIAGAVLFSILWFLALLVTPAILHEIEKISDYGLNISGIQLFDPLRSYWFAFGPMSLAIALLQLSYITITAIIIAKKRKTKSGSKETTLSMSNREENSDQEKSRGTIPVRNYILLSVFVGVLIGSTVVSSILVSSWLTSWILDRIDESIPSQEINPPIAISTNSRTNLTYILHEGSYSLWGAAKPSISVINDHTNIVVDTIYGLDDSPAAIVVNPTTNMIYVAYNSYNPYSTGNRLSVIDASTNRVVDEIPVHTQDYEPKIAINPNTNTIYLADSGLHTLVAIDASSKTQKTTQLPGVQGRYA